MAAAMYRRKSSGSALPSHGGGGGYYNNGGYVQQSSNGYGGTSGGVEYGGYTQPTVDTTNGYHRHPSTPSKRKNDPFSDSNRWIWTIIMLVCGFLFLCSTLYYRGQYSTALQRLNVESFDEAMTIITNAEKDKQKNSQVSKTIQDSLKRRLEKLEQEKRTVEQERNTLREQLENNADAKKSLSREDALKHQLALLQNATQRESRRACIDKFGPGPHYVKLTLQFPTDEEGQEHYLIVEMAPLDLMPHAVHLFLEQVAHQLWDDCFFYVNGPHIMQAGPQDYELDDEEDDEEEEGTAKQRFIDNDLDHLAFPEYSDKFPHVPFTLGFTGRPGGPDFYINKGDNTVPHGPGGQPQYGLREQADPCFAKIVEGQDLVKQMHELPTYPAGSEYQHYYEEPVTIREARILSSPPKLQKNGDTTAHNHHKKPRNPRKVDDGAQGEAAS